MHACTHTYKHLNGSNVHLRKIVNTCSQKACMPCIYVIVMCTITCMYVYTIGNNIIRMCHINARLWNVPLQTCLYSCQVYTHPIDIQKIPPLCMYMNPKANIQAWYKIPKAAILLLLQCFLTIKVGILLCIHTCMLVFIIIMVQLQLLAHSFIATHLSTHTYVI